MTRTIQFGKVCEREQKLCVNGFPEDCLYLFYINVRTVSVCYNNLCNDDEVIDHTGGDIEMIH
jgi:hypothetical protein